MLEYDYLSKTNSVDVLKPLEKKLGGAFQGHSPP